MGVSRDMVMWDSGPRSGDDMVASGRQKVVMVEFLFVLFACACSSLSGCILCF